MSLIFAIVIIEANICVILIYSPFLFWSGERRCVFKDGTVLHLVRSLYIFSFEYIVLVVPGIYFFDLVRWNLLLFSVLLVLVW